jgi:type IV secretion system protein VirB9
MKNIPVALLALALFASPAHASPDSRLRTVNFETDKIVQLQGRLGYQSMVEFGPGEQIENVAVGDSGAWQVTPNKRANLLFLKPLVAKAKTNMTVVTDQRVYLFDLSVAGASSSALYNLRFTYDPPRQPHRVPYPRLLGDAPPQRVASATAPYRAAAPAVQPNFAWKRKGDKEILPARTYDDGRSVFMQWKGGAPLPALFTRAGKQETPLYYRQVGGFIVVDQVPREIVMRLGKHTALLVNRKKNDRPTRVAER